LLRKWPLEPVSRRPVRAFNAPLICLSHPAMDDGEWSFRVVSRHGLPVINRRLCF
jgi:hypothetical protein